MIFCMFTATVQTLLDIEDGVESDFTHGVMAPDGDRLTNQKMSVIGVEQYGVSQSDAMTERLRDSENRVRQLEEELSRILGDLDKVK